MAESLRQYWYMWLALLVLIVVTGFVMKKASGAVKKRREIMKKQEEEIKRYKFLLEKYTDITSDDAEKCEADELVEGITAVLQRKIEKAVHLEEEFEKSEEWCKIVYALYYFAEDVKTSLSFFFKNNGEPLPKLAVKGVEAIGETDISSIVSSMYAMYDDSNENVSVDAERIAELDKKFSVRFNRDRFFKNAKSYITDNLK